MKFYLAFALSMVSVASFASTEYLLIPSEDAVSASDTSVARGKPIGSLFLEEANGKCGYKDDGLGGYVDDTDFDGTAYGVSMVRIGQNDWTQDRQVDAQQVGEAASPGKKYTSITELTDRGTCTGSGITFKKYSATCDGCTQ